jgi:ribosomal-protein-serine acetyltransferase
MTMVLELWIDEHLHLKKLTLQDARQYFALVDHNREHLSQYHEPTSAKYKTLDNVIESIKHPINPDKNRFGIWETNQFVGSINATCTTPSCFVIGYWLGEEYTGKGYATRSVKRILDYLIIDLKALEVHAFIHADNTPSRKVVERVGMMGQMTSDGKWHYTISSKMHNQSQKPC